MTQHKLTSREYEYGILVCEEFQNLETGHEFDHVTLRMDDEEHILYSHNKGKIHLQKSNETDQIGFEHDRLNGLTTIFKLIEPNETLTVTYVKADNSVLLELPPKPFNPQNAVTIRNYIKKKR